jgi:DNA-directed RNA polymerase specialized sigma24 family protein
MFPVAELEYVDDCWVTAWRSVVGPHEDRSRGEGHPISMDANSDLFTQSVEDDNESVEQWQCVRRRMMQPPPKQRTTITQLYQAYEEATGTSLGCD